MPLPVSDGVPETRSGSARGKRRDRVGPRAAICPSIKWHKVADGDSCYSLAKKYKVAEAQIKKWNPGINCKLWKDYDICVGA